MDVLLSPKVIEITIAPTVTIATGTAGATNLTTTRTASSVTVESSTGLDAVVPQATNSLAGVMAASDKAALDFLGTQVSGHLGAYDPHTQYLTQARGDSRYRQLGNIPANEITGTLADSQIPASIARDSEVSSAITAITPASIGAATSAQGAKADTALQSTSNLDATRLTGTVPIGSIPAQVALAANVEPSGNRTLVPTGTDPGNTATINGFLAWLLQAVRVAQATLSGLGALATKNTISDVDISAGAAIALSKLATDPLARANHTGTQLASTISDFNSAVTARLNASSIDALSDVVSTSPTVGQVLKWNGSAYVNDVDSTSGGAGATNLTIANRTTTTLDVISDTGLDATVPSATTALAGLMTSTDKTKLDGIAPGATANATDAQLRDRATHTGFQPFTSIASVDSGRFLGRIAAGNGAAQQLTSTEATSLLDLATSALKGLLSPADKVKLDGIATGATANSSDIQLRDRSTHTGTQAISTVTGLQAALDAKQAASALLDALVSGFAGATSGQVPQKNGSTITWTTVASSSGRPLATSQPVYYVSTTGSDSNNGLTAGTAFLTIQKAVDTLATIDCNGFNPRIVLAAGTYVQTAITGLVLKNLVGVGGFCSIEGDVTSPENYKIQATGPNTNFAISAIRQSSTTLYRLVGVEIGCATSDDNYPKYLNTSTDLVLDRCGIRGNNNTHDGLVVYGSASIKIERSLALNGTFRWVCDLFGAFTKFEAPTPGSFEFRTTSGCQFTVCVNGVNSSVIAFASSHIGTFVGKRFEFIDGYVETYGQGQGLPGNTAGTYSRPV